jgi:hypothetical protein
MYRFSSFSFPDLQELLQGEAQHRSQATLNTDSASQWNFLKLESFKNLPDFMLQQYDCKYKLMNSIASFQLYGNIS